MLIPCKLRGSDVAKLLVPCTRGDEQPLPKGERGMTNFPVSTTTKEKFVYRIIVRLGVLIDNYKYCCRLSNESGICSE